MKKYLVFLCAMFLVLGGSGMVGVANAINFTHQSPDISNMQLGKGTDPNSGTVYWTHLMPADFQVSDIVNSAVLELKINKLDEEENVGVVTVNAINFGNIDGDWISQPNHTWYTSIGSFFATWETGDTLEFRLVWETPDTYKSNGQAVDNWMNFQTATFKLDYENADALLHTPEPATMLLLGSGLVGLAGFRKFRKS